MEWSACDTTILPTFWALNRFWWFVDHHSIGVCLIRATPSFENYAANSNASAKALSLVVLGYIQVPSFQTTLL